ncbi:ATP synthase subunit d, mitochondrial [Gracilariopsis chorda]|uniref:ATP synthase subunit d, mitochondrial n=1 Tax=Gracilariopsis chorda TaxID=448386 RepID=A0A2V3J2H7_9FLOR|nr:ATP synthase subunit d, mitochondrial [Gracilariopsis chorda]|eukprot:PXF48543.1 ATP synthase subunit d, mitochondrial [Gracilariopsis chorda]
MIVSSVLRGVLRSRAPILHTARRSYAAATTKENEIQSFDPSQWFPQFSDTAVRSELSKIRDIESELMQALDVKEVPIDWEQWNIQIKYPGLVDELKSLYEATPVPDIAETKKAIDDEIEAVFQPIIEEFSKMAKEAEAETAELEKRCEEITYLRDNIANLTVDEFLDKYPAVKKSIEDDIANNRWFVRDS